MDRPNWSSFPVSNPSEEAFRHYFVEVLGSYYGRAHELFRLYGSENAFKLCSLLWLAQQKHNLEDVISALERAWNQVFSQIPDIVTRGVQFRHFVETCYAEFFPETFGGLPVSSLADVRSERGRPSGLILPPNVRL